MRCKSFFAMLTLLLSVSLTAGEPQRHVSVLRQAGKVYLARGSQRLPMAEGGQWVRPDSIPKRYHLSGYTVELPVQVPYLLLTRNSEIRITRSGKAAGVSDMRRLLERWLQDDHLWGGHPFANQMRYYNSRGRGLSGYVSDFMPTGCSAMAVISWFSMDASFQPIVAQHLARFSLRPRPELVVLTLLSETPTPCRFRHRSRLLLFARGDSGGNPLWEIAPDGKKRGYLPISRQRTIPPAW
ncbi:MAG: hypothetical protein IT210_25355 [Armatimonadetes bacterium]|nr:hypothetical protein [Armatimonadota bacterium]